MLTFGKLALDSPRGCATLLLSGPHKGQEVDRNCGKAPGTPPSHAKSDLWSKGWKFKHARGPWASHRCKN
ncbi:60S ribosomal protein L18 [Myotis brandtii]|uniref:60S ribosomal protein L18 n=1 Tax=Myotis brandtii TaxID=109478 RepID=S7P754_MYOBR|nr:60S ribosomal protein L18 [Myotis brandtii]